VAGEEGHKTYEPDPARKGKPGRKRRESDVVGGGNNHRPAPKTNERLLNLDVVECREGRRVSLSILLRDKGDRERKFGQGRLETGATREKVRGPGHSTGGGGVLPTEKGDGVTAKRVLTVCCGEIGKKPAENILSMQRGEENSHRGSCSSRQKAIASEKN